MSDDTYNGWYNRATWAMALNLSNDYNVYMHCEHLARRASVNNENDEDTFHEELATALKAYGTELVKFHPSALPDFDPAGHESPDPKDNNGPDDLSEVNWREIADGYNLSQYV